MSQFVWNGLTAGLTYSAVALAVTLIFGLARVVHFAVADFAVVAAFVILAGQESWDSWPLAVAAGVVAAVVMAVLSDRLVFRFTFGKPVTGFITSLALIFIARAVIVELFGAESRTAATPVQGTWEVAGVLVRKQVALNAALVLALIVAIYLLLVRTRFGLSLRSVADDQTGALLMGVPVRRVISVAFVLSGITVALVAWIMVTTGAVDSVTGNAYILKGFAAALIGGLGHIQGSLVAGILVGVAESLAIGYGPQGWSQVFLFGVVIVVLILRPNGLWRGVEGADLHS